MARLKLYSMYDYDNTIFDEMVLPAGIDRKLVIDKILYECLPFSVVYPDPIFMHHAIENWSKTCLPVWEHLNETLHYEYNPIWNKDGSYTEQRTNAARNSNTAVASVKGFNSNAWSEHEKTDASGDASGSENVIRKEQGNIGVTTTQQMIKEEREIAEFNLISYIAEDFKNRFCILVY